MFVQLESRHRPGYPWATTMLVLVCVAAFLWLNLSSAQVRSSALLEWGVVPATLFAGWPLPLRFGTLFSAQFLHANWLHLLGNLMFLVIFGLPAERALRWRRYLVLFLVGGAVANLAGAWTLTHSRAVIVGCSGAVSAVVGAYLALFPRAKLGVVLPLGVYFEFVRVPALLLIGFWVMLQLIFTYVGPSFGAVVWWAHIAGFLFGLLYAALSRPALARRQRAG